MFYGMSPVLASALAAQGGLPQDGTPPTPLGPQPDPTAPPPPIPGFTDQPLPPLSFDSVNSGINSVGRPADLAQVAGGLPDPASGINQAKADAAMRKLDRQTKGEALLALGANLLSSRTFGEGLGKGLQAYVQTLKAARPTRKPIGDGEYEEVTDPRTGQTSYIPTQIHADKLAALVADRTKPVISGTHVYQYGVDQTGAYNGSIKDLAPQSLEPKVIHDASGNETIVFVDTDTGAVYDPKNGSQISPPTNSAASPSPSPSPDASAPGGAAGFDKAMAFSLPHEGGLTTDINGYPVNKGINAKFNPGVDVKNLTTDQATQIYKSKYWDKSQAPNLPAAMQTPYFDTYIISPKRADQFLAQSGGDPNKFMDLREAWQAKEAAANPTLAHGIANRNNDLRATIASAAPSGDQSENMDAPYYPADSSTPPGPTNQWGLQPHKFGTGAPAVRYMSADEKKAAGLPVDAVAQVDAKGHVSMLEKGTTPGSDLTPDAVDAQATAYLKTGKMPALGLGNATVRNSIINRAAAMLKEHGMSDDDLPYMQAAYNADVKARTTRAQQLSYMNQAVNTAKQHGREALNLALTIPGQTNLKLWNLVSQGVLDQTSNPQLYALQSAAKQAEAEVAKVITGNPNSGAGQLTDEARREFKILEGPAGPQAKKEAWQTIVRMMDEKTSSVHQEMNQLDLRIHGGIDAYASKPAAAPKAAPATGTVSRGYRFKGGNPADPNNWTKM